MLQETIKQNYPSKKTGLKQTQSQPLVKTYTKSDGQQRYKEAVTAN
ncbi:hypothetical protein NG798_15250 [Ancylothrix sp. C2]|nr:hypothetical protein [Ancylothrix sp. D3o]MCT7951155.1 hypothetical protein [Ancylothrix sp. D3o]